MIIHSLRKNHNSLALLLIENAWPHQLDSFDEYGQTALHVAIQKYNLKAAQLLLDKGCKVNILAKDGYYGQMSALQYAACIGNYEAVKLLIQNRANPLLENSHNLTAKDLAYQNSYVEIGNYLAKIETKYNNSNKIIDFAAFKTKTQKQPKLRPFKP